MAHFAGWRGQKTNPLQMEIWVHCSWSKQQQILKLLYQQTVTVFLLAWPWLQLYLDTFTSWDLLTSRQIRQIREQKNKKQSLLTSHDYSTSQKVWEQLIWNSVLVTYPLYSAYLFLIRTHWICCPALTVSKLLPVKTEKASSLSSDPIECVCVCSWMLVQQYT